jgi:virginiamycin B lyase
MAAARQTSTRWRLKAIAVAVAGSVLAVGGYSLWARLGAAAFVEYAMPNPQDAPIAIATAVDGSVWFTIDQADAIGRWRDGRIERLPTPGRNFEPLGLAAAADASAWYTDIAAGAIVRISATGEASRFVLNRPIVRLGRLAIAPDGAAWFADLTGYGITQLKDGVFRSHDIGMPDAQPYGVAVAPDGVVWATLQRGDKLLRIEPGGTVQTIDLPRRGSVPTDIALGPDGSVWFLQFRANRVARLQEGRFSDFEVAAQNAGLSGLAVATDGAVWFGMVRSSSLGRLHQGRVETFRLPRPNARPYSIGIDRDGNVWYADITGYVGMLPARYARVS